jgi:hypothetical protein
MREEEVKSRRNDVAGEEVVAASLEAAGGRGSGTKLEDADKASESGASATSTAPVDGPPGVRICSCAATLLTKHKG